MALDGTAKPIASASTGSSQSAPAPVVVEGKASVKQTGVAADKLALGVSSTDKNQLEKAIPSRRPPDKHRPLD